METVLNLSSEKNDMSESQKILELVELKKKKVKDLGLDTQIENFIFGDELLGKHWGSWYKEKTQSDEWFKRLKEIVGVQSIQNKKELIEDKKCDLIEIQLEKHKFTFGVTSSFRYSIDDLSFGELYVYVDDTQVMEFRCIEYGSSYSDRVKINSLEKFTDGEWVIELLEFFKNVNTFDESMNKYLHEEQEKIRIKNLKENFQITDEELKSIKQNTEINDSYSFGNKIGKWVKDNQFKTFLLISITFLILFVYSH